MASRTDKLIIIRAWLFRAAPDSIRSYLLSEVKKDKPLPNKFVHPAGRIFYRSEEILSLFESMSTFAEKQKNQPQNRWYTIKWLYAAKRLLNTSDEAVLSLN